MPATSRTRALVSEFVGTTLLLATVVGSGIMGEKLGGGIAGLALLANSVATGAVLLTLIFTFAPLSGAHFNPAVSIAAAIEGGFWRDVPGGNVDFLHRHHRFGGTPHRHQRRARRSARTVFNVHAPG